MPKKRNVAKLKTERAQQWMRFSFLLAGIALTMILSSVAVSLAEQVPETLVVNIKVNGTTENIANYTLEELTEMPQTRLSYSSVNAYDAPSLIVAEGITLSDFLGQIAVNEEDISSIVLRSSDRWTSSFDSSEYLNGTRYVYPEIFENGEEYSAVPSMLALKKYESRAAGPVDDSQLSSSDGISFCFGQEQIMDKVSIGFGKYINSMTIVLKDGVDFNAPKEPYGTGKPEDAEEDAGGEADRDQSREPAPEEDTDRGLTADTLTITVGYYGGPYHVKKVFTLEDLYTMNLSSQAYTYIDNMPAVVMESAKGIRLSDLLDASGIDVNSVEGFHFYCSDVTTSWYQSINKEYLLDTLRYYYPRLPESWDYDTSEAGAQATDGAEEVETIIALEDNWQRFAIEPDFDHLVKKSRFRLLFGQSDTTTKNAYRSARWIHTIEVMLGGTPPKDEAADAAALSTEVGSKNRQKTYTDNSGTKNRKKAESDKNAGGVQKWRVYEMSENAVELPELQTENPLLPLIALMAVFLLFAGIGYGIIRFYREVSI